jgi:hypothetical protein
VSTYSTKRARFTPALEGKAFFWENQVCDTHGLFYTILLKLPDARLLNPPAAGKEGKEEEEGLRALRERP